MHKYKGLGSSKNARIQSQDQNLSLVVKNEKFYIRNIKYNNFILSITINKDEYFEISYIDESIDNL